jgi:hypothetical protein
MPNSVKLGLVVCVTLIVCVVVPPLSVTWL